MKVSLLSIYLFFSFFSISGISQTKSNAKNSITIQTGYNRGFGVLGSFSVHQIAQGLPGNFRFGIGMNWLNPGNGDDARRIFINNATNGVLKKKGRSFDFRVDYMTPSKLFNLNNSYIIFGPRYSSFDANFNFIGGNETFDIKSKQWGIGLGFETFFKMSKTLDLSFATGLDYFLNSKISGHDTSYSPNDENINPRNDNQNNNVPFTFKDANDAIKQPQLMPRFMVGVLYRL